MGYQVQPPPAGYPSWEAFLKANDIDADTNSASAIVDPDGARPRIYFQRVPEGKSAKNRVHLDINVVGRRDVDDSERRRLLNLEADRLAGLGAARGELLDQNGEVWVLMSDPEGNEFCLQ